MNGSMRTYTTTGRFVFITLVLILFAAGIAVRLYDLSDLPLDFHPTRQLLSELKARGMYFKDHPELPDWQRRMAIQQWQTKAEVEPEVFERLVAYTYRFTGVETWVARVYSSLFWLCAAAFLFLLVREQLSGIAALASLGYFLFLPYAVIASRSFQPDVLMVMLVVMFWWMFARWLRTESWGWTIVAGIVGGLAIYVKFVAAFLVLGAALGAGLAAFGSMLSRKRQVWVMALLGVLPAALYLYYGVVRHDFLGRQFAGRFIPALLLSPLNYMQWTDMANQAVGALAIAAGLLGLMAARQKSNRWMLGALWLAYLVYGLFFDYHVATHDYYHLPLIAIVALSIAPLAEFAWEQVEARASNALGQWATVALFAYAALSGAWVARSQLAAVDYRPQAAMWTEIGDVLAHGPNVVALTQDYGSRLAYWGWQNAIIWPSTGDADYRQARGGSIDFEELFAKLTLGNKYFLVTDFDELARQPALKDRLSAYAVFASGEGYVIYDLEAPQS
ncbi:MAG TPA: glycosyltransferase family 39 protein [Anaerolineales bacterium]|nr:glycosyltransferase family 39 protein [Anaerolineales bacterium]